MDNSFIDGIWFPVQTLVLAHGQPAMARDIIKEAGLSLRQCVQTQKRSDYRMLEMLKFIEQELNGKI